MCGETLKGIDPSLMSLNSIKIFVSLKKLVEWASKRRRFRMTNKVYHFNIMCVGGGG